MIEIDMPSGFIKHGWLENLRTEWRFRARKITNKNGPFFSTPCLITGGYPSFGAGKGRKERKSTLPVVRILRRNTWSKRVL